MSEYLDQMSDEGLMNRIGRRGDREACNVLIMRHKAHTFALAMQLTGNRDDALETAQEAFVKLFTRAAQFDPTRAFWPWFVTILKNNARSLQRSVWRRRRAPDPVVIEQAKSSSDPEAAARLSELWCELQGLPAELREVMVLRHQEEMSYAQIAEALQIPQNTVATRIHRARQLLVEALDG